MQPPFAPRALRISLLLSLCALPIAAAARAQIAADIAFSEELRAAHEVLRRFESSVRGASIALRRADGIVHDYRILAARRTASGGVRLLAHHRDSGERLSLVVAGDGGLRGRAVIYGRRYELVSDRRAGAVGLRLTALLHRVVRRDADTLHPPRPARDGAAGLVTAAGSAAPRAHSGARSTIRLLIVHPQELETPQATAEDLVGLTNSIYAASDTNIVFELADVMRLRNVPANDNQALRYVTGNANVDDWRRAAKADIVVLLKPYNGDDTCGIAWQNDPTVSSSELRAFSFASVDTGALNGQFCGDTTMAHEIGHVLGAAHDRANTSLRPALPYAYGDGVPGRWGTVMSYFEANQRVFSNPDLHCAGDPCGRADYTDVARAFREVGARFAALYADAADRDGDGIEDALDSFPDDPFEDTDTDGDGIGDNGDPQPRNAYNDERPDGDDVLIGTDAGERLLGHYGNDLLFGGAGDDSLLGGPGDDRLYGGPGDDRLFGDIGIDSIGLRYLPSQYQRDGQRLLGPEGEDRLSGIERASFFGDRPAFHTDVAIDDLPRLGATSPGRVLDLMKRLVHLYIAYFERAPDLEGLAFWFSQIYRGTYSLAAAARRFAGEPEFRASYPQTLTHREFVGRVYGNLFLRDPDPGGWDFWETRLAEGALTRDLFVVALIDGAYAPTSGAADRAYLDARNAVALYYAEQLALHPGKRFDPHTTLLLAEVSAEPDSVSRAKALVDYLMRSPDTLLSLWGDPARWDGFWNP